MFDDKSSEELLEELARRHGAATLAELLPQLELGDFGFVIGRLGRRRIVELGVECAVTVAHVMPPTVLAALCTLSYWARSERHLSVSVPSLSESDVDLALEQLRLAAELGDDDLNAPFLESSAPKLAAALGVEVATMRATIRQQRHDFEAAQRERGHALAAAYATLCVRSLVRATRVLPKRTRPRLVSRKVAHLRDAINYAAASSLAFDGKEVIVETEVTEGPVDISKRDDDSAAYVDVLCAQVTDADMRACWGIGLHADIFQEKKVLWWPRR